MLQIAPFCFITEIRLLCAKRHLENADMPLYEIARSCGFGSYINFYKCFRQVEGCIPETRRREHRKIRLE